MIKIWKKELTDYSMVLTQDEFDKVFVMVDGVPTPRSDVDDDVHDIITCGEWDFEGGDWGEQLPDYTLNINGELHHDVEVIL